MKTTTKKITFKKLTDILVLCFALSNLAIAQSTCNANYTYTASISGISVTNTSTGTDTSTNYLWNLSGNYAYGQTAVFSSLYNGSYVVSLTLSSMDSSNSCSSSISQTITIAGGQNAPACSAAYTYTAGSSGLVTFTNTSPSDPYNQTTYSWNFDDGVTASTSSPNHTYYYNGTYTVTLSVFNSISGCSTSYSQVITITNAQTIPACTSNFTYTVGSTGQVSFTSLYTGADTNAVWWSFGDGNGNVGENPINTYAYNGTYTITSSIHDSLANCFSATTQTISITNTANQPCVPAVNFNMHQDSLNPQPGIWQVSAYYSSQVTSAVWNWGDGTSSSGLYPTHTYTAAGHYNICVTAYASCGDSAYACQNDSLYRTGSVIQVTVINAVTAGIKTNTAATAQVSLYPNPNTGLFTLNISNASVNTETTQISITNLLGENVYAAQEAINAGSISKSIDIQNMANGAYFMKVIIGDKAYTQKLIINK